MLITSILITLAGVAVAFAFAHLVTTLAGCEDDD